MVIMVMDQTMAMGLAMEKVLRKAQTKATVEKALAKETANLKITKLTITYLLCWL